MDSNYKIKFRGTIDVDDERILISLVRHLGLPLLILRIVEITDWKPFVKATVEVLAARKWAKKILEEHGVELHPELDLRAQENDEYLEWVPDAIPTDEKRAPHKEGIYA